MSAESPSPEETCAPPSVEPLALGSLLVARGVMPAAPCGARGEVLSLRLPASTDDAVLADPFGASGQGAAEDGTVVLLAPRRLLAGLLPEGAPRAELAASVGLKVLRRYVEGLLGAPPDRLCVRQAELAGGAVLALLEAARAGPKSEHGLGSRRRASLLNRLTAHIDAHLSEEHAADTLCSALGCSRSALYRATADVGGVAEWVQRRRLLAVHTRLHDAREARPITDIALECGFTDPVRFNRRFRSLFGASAGEVRHGSGSRRRALRPPAASRVQRRAPS